LRRDRCPHVAAIAEAVQHRYRRSAAAHPDVKFRSVGVDHLRVKAAGKRLNRCDRRGGRQNRCPNEHQRTKHSCLPRLRVRILPDARGTMAYSTTLGLGGVYLDNPGYRPAKISRMSIESVTP